MHDIRMDHLGLTFHLFVAADKLKHVLMDGWMDG